MQPLLLAATGLIGSLADAGINAAIDTRDLVLPGVLVTPATSRTLTLDRSQVSVTLSVTVVVPDTGTLDTLDQLDQLITRIEHVMDHAPTWEIASATLPGLAPDPLPAATCEVSALARKDA